MRSNCISMATTAFAAAAMLAACSNSAHPDDRTDRALRVGVVGDAPGLSLKVGDRFEGYDVEIARLIASGLGKDPANIEWKVTANAADRETYLRDGTADMVVSTYTITDARKQVLSFAGPYYVAGQGLAVRSDSRISGFADLAGKSVCTAAGTTTSERMDQSYPGAKLLERATTSVCMDALAEGRADAATGDDLVLAGFSAQLQHRGQFRMVGQPISKEPYGIGLRFGDPLCPRINEILVQAAADGTYAKAWDDTLAASGVPAPALDPSALTNCTGLPQ